MLASILNTIEAFGEIQSIVAPVGLMSVLEAELSEHPELLALSHEGVDNRLHIQTLDGAWWYYGGFE